MPHANIWIRKDNWEDWEAIPDKSNWINTLLENSGDTSSYGAVIDEPIKRTVVLSEQVKEKVCKKHGVDKSVCSMMKH